MKTVLSVQSLRPEHYRLYARYNLSSVCASVGVNGAGPEGLPLGNGGRTKFSRHSIWFNGGLSLRQLCRTNFSQYFPTAVVRFVTSPDWPLFIDKCRSAESQKSLNTLQGRKLLHSVHFSSTSSTSCPRLAAAAPVSCRLFSCQLRQK